jgi:hypothetical protein
MAAGGLPKFFNANLFSPFTSTRANTHSAAARHKANRAATPSAPAHNIAATNTNPVHLARRTLLFIGLNGAAVNNNARVCFPMCLCATQLTNYYYCRAQLLPTGALEHIRSAVCIMHLLLQHIHRSAGVVRVEQN